MTRHFVAVRPPPEVVEKLRRLPRPDEPGVRWVPPEQWHVTLRFLGSADEADTASALSSVDLPAARADLGPVVSRLGRSVVVVPVAGLDGLAEVVRTATADLGEPPDPRGFSGHLTLARLRHRAACGVAGTPFSASFEVREVEVVTSRTLPEGAVHEVVARLAVARHRRGDDGRGGKSRGNA